MAYRACALPEAVWITAAPKGLGSPAPTFVSCAAPAFCVPMLRDGKAVRIKSILSRSAAWFVQRNCKQPCGCLG